jgi:chromate transporter
MLSNELDATTQASTYSYVRRGVVCSYQCLMLGDRERLKLIHRSDANSGWRPVLGSSRPGTQWQIKKVRFFRGRLTTSNRLMHDQLEDQDSKQASSQDRSQVDQESSTAVEAPLSPPEPAEPSDEDQSFAFRMKEVVVKCAPLGLIAFGGPNAHIALLQERFVEKHKWIDDATFLELFGLCQALPGPTSTQLVIALATMKAGIPGGILAFVMWSLPCFVIMTIAGVTSGLFFNSQGGIPDWMAGLGPSATAMVFLAAFQLSKSVVNSLVKIFCAALACVGTLLVMGDARIDPRLGSVSFPVVLLLGGLITLADSRRPGRLKEYFMPPPDAAAADAEHRSLKRRINIPRKFAASLIGLWLFIVVIVVVLRGVGIITDALGVLFESMYRIGSLIYGGGQVVLPMMLQENYCSQTQFFQGFALIQALPGPLFNFSAFLGAVNSGVPGAIVAYIALNLPGMLLVFGVLPFWHQLRRIPNFKVLITGISAAGLGLVYTACVQLWEASVLNAAGSAVFVCSGVAAGFFKVPVPFAIIGGSILGFILSKSAADIAQKPYCPALVTVNGSLSG